MTVLLLFVLAQDTQAKSDFARLVPPDTQIFVSVRDLTALRARLDAAGLKDIRENEQIKEFIRYVESLRPKAEGEAKDILGDLFPFDKVYENADGEWALAIGPIDFAAVKEGGDFAVPEKMVMLVDARTKADAMAALVEGELKRAVDAGARKEEESYKGVTIVQLTSNAGNKMAIARTGSVWAVAPSIEALKPLIQRQKEGAADSLADSAEFKSIQAQVGPSADAIAFVNVKPLVKGANDALTADDPAGLGYKMLIKIYGLESMDALGAGLTVGTESIDVVGFAQIKELTGMLKAYFPDAENPKIPDYIGDDSHMVSATHFDWGIYFATYLEIMEEALGGMGVSAEDLMAQMEAQLGFNIKEDLIDQIKSPMVTTVSFPKEGAHLLLALPLKDSGKVRDAIQSMMDLAAQNGENAQEEDYMDTKIYSFAETFSLSIKNDTGLVGLGDSVKPAIRRMGKAEGRLVDSEGYRELSKYLPERYSGVTYMPAEGMARLVESFKDGSFFKMIPNAPAEPFDGEFDPEKIPDPRIVTNHVKGMISWMGRVDGGAKWAARLALKKN